MSAPTPDPSPQGGGEKRKLRWGRERAADEAEGKVGCRTSAKGEEIAEPRTTSADRAGVW